jgi:hypothetical protein
VLLQPRLASSLCTLWHSAGSGSTVAAPLGGCSRFHLSTHSSSLTPHASWRGVTAHLWRCEDADASDARRGMSACWLFHACIISDRKLRAAPVSEASERPAAALPGLQAWVSASTWEHRQMSADACCKGRSSSSTIATADHQQQQRTKHGVQALWFSMPSKMHFMLAG